MCGLHCMVVLSGAWASDAGVAELVDAADLKSAGPMARPGSSPGLGKGECGCGDWIRVQVLRSIGWPNWTLAAKGKETACRPLDS